MVVPKYSGDVSGDVFVLTVTTQNQAEGWNYIERNEERTGIRMICKVPQGGCQLYRTKREREKKQTVKKTVMIC